ncbi:GrpB family protein, partial [Candidatus Woesearchaeota archaeon]|nr:GrpB family protein [Candidatus Woesearchaeota archaeon]
HIGSTAIPEMPGKNIIDVLIPCETGDFNRILARLDSVGFQKNPYPHVPPERPLSVGAIQYESKKYNVHVTLVQQDSDLHKNNLFFREYLKTHEELAQEYAKVKQRAVKDGQVEAKEYNDAKSPFIRSVLAKL